MTTHYTKYKTEEYVDVIEKLLAKRRQLIIKQFTTKQPKLSLCRSDHLTTDEEQEELHEFTVDNLKDKFSYMTGLSVIYAAWDMAEGQIHNAQDVEAKELAEETGERSIYKLKGEIND